MEEPKGSERRRYERYDTDLDLEFTVGFDIHTKVDYRIRQQENQDFSVEKYHAISKNISAEGICFSSGRCLNAGDVVLMDLFVPSSKVPICMEGEVRWSRISNDPKFYDTGVLVLSVDGQSVLETVFVDEQTNVKWSIVLENVFSRFKRLAKERKEKEE